MKIFKDTFFSKKKKHVKNNRGMTYIELLVALALLVLIVTMFSPMLLSSYENLYNAGEKTSGVYDAKYEIEQGLSIREDDNMLSINTNFVNANFQNFGTTISVKARQIASVFSGLETLYANAKGKIRIVGDTRVSDNQDYQVIKLEMVNLNKTPVKSTSATDAQSPGAKEVKFYITSVFNSSTQCNYTLSKEGKYVHVLLSDVDVTQAPIQIKAYYLDEDSKLQDTEAYLFIEPADMIFVGESKTDAEYFTSAGIDNGDLIISNREMTTAKINTATLNDVEWVSKSNDSTVYDGYYLMCGENSVVRRLWHTQSAKPNITYGDYSIAGTTYYRYDWKGDFTDDYKHMSQAGAGDSGYGDSLESVGKHPITRDKYGLNGSSYAYSFNGFTGGWYDTGSNRSVGLGRASKRISYVLYATESSSPIKGEKGMWASWTTSSRTYHRDNYEFGDIIHSDLILDTSDDAVYNISNKTWYKRNDGIRHYYSAFTRDDGSVLKYDKTSNKPLWIHGKNAMTYQYDTNGFGNMKDYDAFFARNGVPDGNGWTNSANEWVSDKVTGDEDIAYLAIKMYNNFSSNELKNYNNTVSFTGSNPISLKSCSALPGRNGDTMYYGTTNANALIHQTTGLRAGDTNIRKQGVFTGYFFAGGNDSAGQPVTKMIKYAQNDHNGERITSNPSPDWQYAVKQLASAYQNKSVSISDWDQYIPDDDSSKKIAFTMGYASDLFTLYNSFSESGTKPLESSYMASTGVTTDNEKFHKNVWLTRDFYNIVESDSYGESVVAVGYNVSGLAKLNTNIVYFAGDSDISSTFLNNNKGDNWELDLDKVSFSSDWKACEKESNMYCLKGADKGKKFWVKLPKEVVVNTELDRLLNDGVISVFNKGDTTFTNIYYHRDDNNKSIRFNCVSTMGISDSVVGAAIGMNTGEIMLARLPYGDNQITPVSIDRSNTDTLPQTAEISTITTIKAFNYNFFGDSNPENIIFASGTRVSGKNLVVRLWDATTPEDKKAFNIVVNGSDSDSVTEITDIEVAGGYLYLSANTSSNNGIIYVCPLMAIKDALAKTSGSTIYLAEGSWIVQQYYKTSYTVDENGNLIASGEVKLPKINSIATRLSE